MDYRSHPDDEWIDVTRFGQMEPELIRGRSVWAAEVARARAAYVEGRIEIEDFEEVLEHALAP